MAKELYVETFPIAANVLDTSGAPWVAYIFANFRKKSKFHNKENQGLGGSRSLKKPEAKNFVTLSLSAYILDPRYGQ